MYPEEIVIPMKGELTENGFVDLTTEAEVENALAKARHHVSCYQFRLRMFSRNSASRMFYLLWKKVLKNQITLPPDLRVLILMQ